jgi:hypothetical protein
MRIPRPGQFKSELSVVSCLMVSPQLKAKVPWIQKRREKETEIETRKGIFLSFMVCSY